MVTESLMKTLEADEESVLSGNEINEPDFFSNVPISAAGSIDIVGTLDDATPEGQLPLYGDFTQTPPIDSDSEAETNPNGDGENTFHPFPDEKFFLLYCYSHGIMRPKVRLMIAYKFLFYLFNYIYSHLSDNVRPSLMKTILYIYIYCTFIKCFVSA